MLSVIGAKKFQRAARASVKRTSSVPLRKTIIREVEDEKVLISPASTEIVQDPLPPPPQPIEPTPDTEIYPQPIDRFPINRLSKRRKSRAVNQKVSEASDVVSGHEYESPDIKKVSEIKTSSDVSKHEYESPSNISEAPSGQIDHGQVQENEPNQIDQIDQIAEPIHEKILAVIVHRTDRIKSKVYITHPMVKVHVVNVVTGEYARKSRKQRAVAYVNETTSIRPDAIDYILPLMTKPSAFRQQDLSAPTWEELLLFNDDFEHFTLASNQIMLMFEILDFKSMSAIKRDSTAAKDTANLAIDVSAIDSRSEGWHRIAWAFLKLVSSNGVLNTGKNLRLQLYKAPTTTKLRDERQPEIYHWWKYMPKVKYAGTLFVTVKSVDYPRHVPSSSRSMYAVQQETINGTMAPTSSQEDQTQNGQLPKEDKDNEEPPYVWSRLTGQPCKVPNKLWMTLACGRGGCFRLKFSPNGRYLAGAGAEQQINKYPIYLYGFPGGKYMGILYGHVQLVYELFWNSTDLLLSASADCTARLWNATYMRCFAILTHTTFVYCARFHPSDDQLIFTGAFDKRIRLWSLKSNHEKPKVIQEFEPHSNYVNCLCFTADKCFLYSGDGAGTLRISAAADENGESWMFLKELKEDRLVGKPINALEIHPDQKRLFIQSRDGCVRAMELRSLALRSHYRGLRNADTHVRGDLTPCGTLYFAGDGDGRVIVWHVQSGMQFAEYNELSLAQCPVTCVSYHPFDHWVAFAVYGLRQPILIYKHDSSTPELHKEEPREKKIEPEEKPAFDPDYSLVKLLEEHRLLTKLDLPLGNWSNSNRKPTYQLPKVSSSSQIDTSKKEVQIEAALTAASKRVTFGDAVQQSNSPAQRNRQAMFAQRDMQQSTLMEIPISDAEAVGQKSSFASTDATPILEQNNFATSIAQADAKPGPQKIDSKVIQQASVDSAVVSASAVIGQVRARYNYTAQNDDEISFQKGDIIKVVRRDDLWWVGYVDAAKIGYFPSNYVIEIE